MAVELCPEQAEPEEREPDLWRLEMKPTLALHEPQESEALECLTAVAAFRRIC